MVVLDVGVRVVPDVGDVVGERVVVGEKLDVGVGVGFGVTVGLGVGLAVTGRLVGIMASA